MLQVNEKARARGRRFHAIPPRRSDVPTVEVKTASKHERKHREELGWREG